MSTPSPITARPIAAIGARTLGRRTALMFATRRWHRPDLRRRHVAARAGGYFHRGPAAVGP